MKNLNIKTFTHQGDKNMHVQSKLLSKLAITCLLIITASWLTFIGCAPITEPVFKDFLPVIADVDIPAPVVDEPPDEPPDTDTVDPPDTDEPPDPVDPPDTAVDPPEPPVPTDPPFIAVGDSGKIALSKDSGVSWEAVDSGTMENLIDLATDGSNFVAVANNGAVVRSTDEGVTWAVVSSTGISSSTTIAEIEYGNGVFALMTYNNSAPFYVFYRSTDGGRTWDNAPLVTDGAGASGLEGMSLTYANGYFLSYRRVPNSRRTMLVSVDGLIYDSVFDSTGFFAIGDNNVKVRVANGRFFLLGNYQHPSTLNRAPTIRHHEATSSLLPSTISSDVWVGHSILSGTYPYPVGVDDYLPIDIAYSSLGRYVFIMNDLTTAESYLMLTRTVEGGSFTARGYAPSTTYKRIIFFNNKFVIACDSGKIVNGNSAAASWREVTSGTTANLVEGAATANKIVFVGDNGKIVVSSDGTTWEEKSAAGNDTQYNHLVLIE